MIYLHIVILLYIVIFLRIVIFLHIVILLHIVIFLHIMIFLRVVVQCAPSVRFMITLLRLMIAIPAVIVMIHVMILNPVVLMIRVMTSSSGVPYRGETVACPAGIILRSVSLRPSIPLSPALPSSMTPAFTCRSLALRTAALTGRRGIVTVAVAARVVMVTTMPWFPAAI